MDLSSRIITNILRNLNSRKGYDGLWDSIDEEVRDEIIDELIEIVEKELNKPI